MVIVIIVVATVAIVLRLGAMFMGTPLGLKVGEFLHLQVGAGTVLLEE